MEGLGAAVDNGQSDVVVGGQVEHGGDGAGIEEGHVAAGDENVIVGGVVKGGVDTGEGAAVRKGVGMVGIEVVAEWLTANVENFLTYGPEGI